MATRRYKISPGEPQNDVVEQAGGATNSDTIELTIDIADDEINLNGTETRKISKEEALDGIAKIRNHIIQNDWPPV